MHIQADDTAGQSQYAMGSYSYYKAMATAINTILVGLVLRNRNSQETEQQGAIL